MCSLPFCVQDDDFESWGVEDVLEQAKKATEPSTLDDKIARVRREKKKQVGLRYCSD